MNSIVKGIALFALLLLVFVGAMIYEKIRLSNYYCEDLGKEVHEVYPCYEAFDCDYLTINASAKVICV